MSSRCCGRAPVCETRQCAGPGGDQYRSGRQRLAGARRNHLSAARLALRAPGATAAAAREGAHTGARDRTDGRRRHQVSPADRPQIPQVVTSLQVEAILGARLQSRVRRQAGRWQHGTSQPCRPCAARAGGRYVRLTRIRLTAGWGRDRAVFT